MAGGCARVPAASSRRRSCLLPPPPPNPTQSELRKAGIKDDEEQRLLSNLRVKVRCALACVHCRPLTAAVCAGCRWYRPPTAPPPTLRTQPLSVQATASASGIAGWSTRKKIIVAGSAGLAFVVLVALVLAHSGGGGVVYKAVGGARAQAGATGGQRRLRMDGPQSVGMHARTHAAVLRGGAQLRTPLCARTPHAAQLPTPTRASRGWRLQSARRRAARTAAPPRQQAQARRLHPARARVQGRSSRRRKR